MMLCRRVVHCSPVVMPAEAGTRTSLGLNSAAPGLDGSPPEAGMTSIGEVSRLSFGNTACRRKCLGKLASILLLLAADFAGARAQDAAPPAGGRDALWRMIFARPASALHANANPDAIALGYDLFRDTRLSGNGRRSCATCHDPARAFSNGAKKGPGLDGHPLKRNVPSLYNVAWGKVFYWDGRAPTLEAQARFPILAANEMAGEFTAIFERLGADSRMTKRFAGAFPQSPQISETSILAALAAYERTLISPQTRFDSWVNGDDSALTEQQYAGFAIFVGKGGCVACHGGWRFTDDAFHDIGLASDDPGRGAVPGGFPGLAEFKTPSLRGVKSTPPYMHDGSLATLPAVADHYSGAFVRRPSLAANIRRDLSLTETEKQALVAFLRSL